MRTRAACPLHENVIPHTLSLAARSPSQPVSQCEASPEAPQKDLSSPRNAATPTGRLAAPSCADPATSAAPAARFHLLVVDDDEGTLRLLQRHLQRRYPTALVDTAKDGHQALEAVRRAGEAGELYSAITMDGVMPNM